MAHTETTLDVCTVCVCVFLQLSGLFTSLVVLIVLLLIGPLFYFLPKVCSYASISTNTGQRKSEGNFSHLILLSLSSGSLGMHQCHQPQADVSAVPRLT